MIEPVARDYEAQYGTKIELQYGGSGTLLSNLEVSHVGDLYIPADESYLVITRQKKLTAEILPLAQMKPLVVVQKGNPKNIKNFQDLLLPTVRLTLANPEAASIGKLTQKLLQEKNLWGKLAQSVKENGVFKPTVFDVANDLKMGAADAGILWDSTLHQYPELEEAPLPLFPGVVSTASVAVLKSTEHPRTALHFARYLTAKDRGMLEVKKRGFSEIESDLWADAPEIVLFSGGINRPSIEATLKEFEEREGVSIVTSFNGCGILVGEMRAGKRPDAYFACDSSYMHQVADLFFTPREISKTEMIILTAKGNPLKIQTLRDLTKPGVRVAIANEKYSALGGLTNRLFRNAGIYEAVQKNITYSDAPTADFLTVRVKTGREDAAIVYLVNALKLQSELEIIHIPFPSPAAIQPISIGKSTHYPRLMQRLIETLSDPSSQSRYESAGFRFIPQPNPTQP